MRTQCAEKAEDRDEMILRLYNPSETRSCDVALSVNREVRACCETDMNEVYKAQGKRAQPLRGLSGGQSRTFSIKLKGNPQNKIKAAFLRPLFHQIVTKGC